MAESKEEPLDEGERGEWKSWLETQLFKKLRSRYPVPSLHGIQKVKKWKQWQILFSWGPKSLWTAILAMKLKDACSGKKSYGKSRQCIKKQRHHFVNKGLYSQSFGFSNSHVGMWELDHKEGWAPKNWCFWIVVLKKTLESPLDCKKIKPVNSKGNQPWIFIRRTNAEAEAPILGPPDAKSQLTGKNPNAGKDWQQETWVTEDEMAG